MNLFIIRLTQINNTYRFSAMENNMQIAKTKFYLFYTSVIALASLITISIAFDDNLRDGYQSLWLLPLSFTLVSMFTINIMNSLPRNLSVAIIWGGYFVRFVLTPLLLMIGNYQVTFRTLTTGNIESAILLMAYEIFVVFICLEIYLKKNKHYSIAMNLNEIDLKLEETKILHFGLIILSLICISILFYIPQLRDSFTWIFSNKHDIANLDYNIDTIAIRGTIKRALSSLFVFIFNIIRYLIPIYLLKITYKRFGNTKLGYVLSLIICVSPFMVISGSNVQPFIGLIINVVMMSKLYPYKSENLKKIFSILGVVLLSLILMSKLIIIGDSRGLSGIDSLGLTLNAYFPGVGNAAAAFNIIDDNKFKTLFYDVFSTIPFRNSIFPSIASEEVTLTFLFNRYNVISGNIIPCISGSKHYLGFFLAPLIPLFLACFSVKMKIKAESSNNYWMYFYFMFFSIRVAMIPNLYNHISFINVAINQFLPMYLAIVFINRIKVRNKNVYY